MKRSYEKYPLILFISIMFVFIFIISCLIINKSKLRTFVSINAIVISKCYVEAFITNYEFSLIKNRNIVYIDNNRYKVRIDSVEKNVLKRKKDNYHAVILKLNIPKKYKDNDYVKISLYENKKKITTIFKSCWKEAK